jgi:5-carboxymethyl-2-hydroxymuconate isomerase
MPHFVIDCSESVLSLADPEVLMRAVYTAAESTGLFAVGGVGGIKVRLRPFQYFLNVDAHEHFVHVFAYVMEGRSAEQKKALSEKVVCALKELLPAVDIVSTNVRDVERATYCNATTIEGRP